MGKFTYVLSNIDVRAYTNKRWFKVLIAIISIHIALLAFGSLELKAQSDTVGEDASAELACTHFRNVAADVSDGLLTDQEMRGKLKEVNDTASVSEYLPVRKAARNLLASVTTGTTDEAVRAIEKMGEACNNYFAQANTADESSQEDGSSNSEEPDSDCFIATAAYGTHLATDIDVLRDFRDENLKTNAPGRLFIDAYYKVGPVAADVIEESSILRAYTRHIVVKPLVQAVELFR